MTSLKSRLLIWAMRHRHILKGRLKKETMKFDIPSVLAFRKRCEEGAPRIGSLPKGITIKQELIHMVLSEWIIPDEAPGDKLIFYVHGGGYVSGSCKDHRVLVSKIAAGAQTTALIYEYGLAPENPFPASIKDSLNVYQAILEKGYHAGNIIMMGESAGGGLCLAILLKIKDLKMPLPKAAIAIQPWTDLSCSGPSYQSKNRQSLAPLNSWNVFSHYYVGKNDVNDPYISPLFGDLDGLPPIYINVGENDELYDDSLRFHEKARQAGVDITVKEGKGMIHCYPLLSPLFPEAKAAMDDILEFIRQHQSDTNHR